MLLFNFECGLISRPDPFESSFKSLYYEADSQDKQFLRSHLLSNVTCPKNSTLETLLTAYEAIIIHFEQTEFKLFNQTKKNKIRTRMTSWKNTFNRPQFSNVDLYDNDNQFFGVATQDLIIKFWKARQKLLKRPLVRGFWKFLHFPEHGFGKQDIKKLAFAPRNDSRMRLRKNYKFVKGRPLIDKLNALKEENQRALFLVQMVKQREILKAQLLRIELFKPMSPNDKCVKVSDSLISSSSNLVEKMHLRTGTEGTNSKFKKSVKREEEEEDMTTFLANVVEQTWEHGFELSEFHVHHREETSIKIRSLQSSGIFHSLKEKQVNSSEGIAGSCTLL